jgi:hypothetical protein
MLTLLLNTAHAKKYYSCSELLKSVAYPTPEDARKMRLKLLVSDGGLTLIKETAKIGISAGLGLTGLPISIGFNLLFKGMKMAGVELGKNHRQMLAVVLVSEELVNRTIDINGDFGKADLMIFENFLSAKREFYKYLRKRLRQDGVSEEDIPKSISNIAFARLVVGLEYFEGTVTYSDGSSEYLVGENFYCKKKRSGRVKFKGFNKNARAMLYKAYNSKATLINFHGQK